ncbi:MAG: hypothetical protein JW881_15925 [Spirochaetales bacterium]|nr:hypothetical protein [Spirochaetales bacterium]
MSNYYLVLGIDKDVYRLYCKRYHPDPASQEEKKIPQNPGSLRYIIRFGKIREYDLSLEQPAFHCTPCSTAGFIGGNQDEYLIYYKDNGASGTVSKIAYVRQVFIADILFILQFQKIYSLQGQ